MNPLLAEVWPNSNSGWRTFFVKRFALIMMVIAAMAVPAVAQAQTNGYGNVVGATPGSSGPSSSGSSSTAAPAASVAATGDEVGGGVLPFTGMQLVLIFGTGVLLMGTGLMLRRARSE